MGNYRDSLEPMTSDERKLAAKQANKRWRERNPDLVKEIARASAKDLKQKELRQIRQRRLNEEKRLKAINLLGGRCAHCGNEYHHSAMDFHHIDPETKEKSNGGKGIQTGLSWDKIENELSKLLLLCANCHRIHHYKERRKNEEHG